VDEFVMPRPGARIRVEFSESVAPIHAAASYVVVAVDPRVGITARQVGKSPAPVPADTPCRVWYSVGGHELTLDALAISCRLEPAARHSHA
jgi:hypothetical protein